VSSPLKRIYKADIETMNSELQALFRADQDERTNHPDYGTPEYWLLRELDAERRKRLEGIVESGG
jgi:hypothetical protein